MVDHMHHRHTYVGNILAEEDHPNTRATKLVSRYWLSPLRMVKRVHATRQIGTGRCTQARGPLCPPSPGVMFFQDLGTCAGEDESDRMMLSCSR